MSYSGLSTHHSGLYDLYRTLGVEVPKTLEKVLREGFKGLNHTLATETANGDARIKVGKDPLGMDLFSILCLELLKHCHLHNLFPRMLCSSTIST